MEQVGWADSIALRGIFAEHVLSSDSQTTFSPPNNPELVCTPERELFFVVGKDGIDTATWEIKPDAHPTYEASAMVSGRNAEHIAKLKEAVEFKQAKLTVAELVALRLYTGRLLVCHLMSCNLKWKGLALLSRRIRC